MRNVFLLILLTLAVAACEQTVIPAELDKSFAPVRIQCQVDAVQPGTGLVLWSENASNRHAAYGKAISLEYAYCLPSQVVTGKDNGVVRYDWSSFNSWLRDVASRGHQAVVRFRYEYPGERSVDGQPGTTAVPEYIKALRGPFRDIPLMSCGGVNAENAQDYFKAGANLVSFGASIFDPKLMAAGDWDTITDKLKKLLAAVK